MTCRKRWDSSTRLWDKKAWTRVKERSEDSTEDKTGNSAWTADVYTGSWGSMKDRARRIKETVFTVIKWERWERDWDYYEYCWW